MVQHLHLFFEINSTIVIFMYGLVYFVLGLGIALQSRRHSRLELARGLGWLAAFGLVHGFFEWGAIFIPIQATYLGETAILFLQVVQVILLVLSFAFLFQFGVEMFRQRWPSLTVLPLAITVIWIFIFFGPWLAFAPDNQTWSQYALIWARYLIGFPGSIFAAFGLRYQAKRTIQPMKMQHIYRMLRVAGIFFLGYAFWGGLVVTKGDFFPANVINEQNLLAYTGIPVAVFRSLIGLALAIAFIRATEVFDMEVDQLIEQATLDRNLALERERIGRELHDNTIQTIYTASLLVYSARQKYSKEDENAQILDRSIAILNEAIADLRSYISELRPSPTGQYLSQAIRASTSDIGWASLVDIHLQNDLPENAAFSPTRTQQVLAILNEAISNAARHGNAHKISVTAQKAGDRFLLTIQDDGVGFQEKGSGTGYGMRNMHDRARLLGGALEMASNPGKGTTIRLDVPWEMEE